MRHVFAALRAIVAPLRRRGTQPIVLLVVIVVALFAAFPVKGSTQARFPADFCRRNLVLRDYLAPLTGLPQGTGFRTTGRLKVGSPVLRIYPPRERLVRIGRSFFEARGSLEGSYRSVRPLNWWIVSRLERTNRTGTRAKLVRAKRQFVARVKGFRQRRFGFFGSVTPGLYRLSVEIENARGRVLGRYDEYYRAVKARSALRLTANFTTLAAGEAGYLRIDNLGTVPSAYGFGYRLWNAQGEEISVDTSFSNILMKLRPGYAGWCFRFKAPSELPPGEYRIGAEAFDPISNRPFPLFKSVQITLPSSQ